MRRHALTLIEMVFAVGLFLLLLTMVYQFFFRSMRIGADVTRAASTLAGMQKLVEILREDLIHADGNQFAPASDGVAFSVRHGDTTAQIQYRWGKGFWRRTVAGGGEIAFNFPGLRGATITETREKVHRQWRIHLELRTGEKESRDFLFHPWLGNRLWQGEEGRGTE